jgi:hypothetical protein
MEATTTNSTDVSTITTNRVLSPLALEVLACLPVGQPGASVPDLAEDCCCDPVYVDVRIARVTVQNHRMVRRAIAAIRAAAPGTARRHGVYVLEDSTAPYGRRRCYALTVEAGRWARKRLRAPA